MAQGSADGQGGTARREQLLRSALEVIVARGYADTRIADVAEHAGISPALVIYYFKTRDRLLTEALRYSEDAWYAAGTQRLASPIGQGVFHKGPVVQGLQQLNPDGGVPDLIGDRLGVKRGQVQAIVRERLSISPILFPEPVGI